MSAIHNLELTPPKWQTAIIFALTFWLSGSLLLDLVIMPEMYAAGMMNEAGFASAGYSIFWIFNRLELLCAAFVLTGAFVLHRANQSTEQKSNSGMRRAIAFAVVLFAITLAYTYGLAPTMSTLGLQLNLFEPAATVPAGMTSLHVGYWTLELVKLVLSGALVGYFYHNRPQYS